MEVKDKKIKNSCNDCNDIILSCEERDCLDPIFICCNCAIRVIYCQKKECQFYHSNPTKIVSKKNADMMLQYCQYFQTK